MDTITELRNGVSERGNYAFTNEEGAAVLFVDLGHDQWLQVAHTPRNYPAWDVSLLNADEDTIVSHIHDNLGGWFITKTQCDLNEENYCVLDADDIIDEVVGDVCKHADCNTCKLIGSVKAMDDAIQASAERLRYLLTPNMRNTIHELIVNNCDLFVDN